MTDVPETSRSSRTDEAFRRLRSDILHGRLEPGSRLRVEALSEQYGVSSGVIREALPRLVGQGLAVAYPQQGVRVVSVNTEDLDQLTEAAIEIETLVLRRSLAEGSVDWEASVLAAHHHLSRLPLHDADGSISDEWAESHSRFHLALLAGCGNHRLTGIAAALRDAGEVYRHWSDRPGDITQDQHTENHRRLSELAVTRQIDAAVSALREHISLTTYLIAKHPPTA